MPVSSLDHMLCFHLARQDGFWVTNKNSALHSQSVQTLLQRQIYTLFTQDRPQPIYICLITCWD